MMLLCEMLSRSLFRYDWSGFAKIIEKIETDGRYVKFVGRLRLRDTFRQYIVDRVQIQTTCFFQSIFDILLEWYNCNKFECGINMEKKWTWICCVNSYVSDQSRKCNIIVQVGRLSVSISCVAFFMHWNGYVAFTNLLINTSLFGGYRAVRGIVYVIFIVRTF